MKQNTIVSTITIRSLKQNKGRNLIAVLAIFLTAMMFTTLFTLAQNMGKNMTEMYLRQSGNLAHSSTKQITDNQIQQIAAHPDVKTSGKSIVLSIAENTLLAGRQVELRFGDEQYARDHFSYPTTGRMPESRDEVALDTIILKRLGIPLELGSKVTLEWRRDRNSSEIISSTFTLCGWWEGVATVYASMAWVSEDFVLDACINILESSDHQILGQRMMTVTFSDTQNIDQKMEKVLADCGLETLSFQTNLAYSPETQFSILQENISLYLGMILVFIAGYLIIFNVFQISVASDIQFYGKLKTLGMTKKQIRKIIYGQGNLLSVLGIPVGLIAGYLFGILLLPVFLATIGSELNISTNPVIFLGSALFTYLTVITSCLLPARLAGKVSPMEALRYTDADINQKRNTRSSRNGASLTGMALANLGRNRKRTIMVICSLTLGFLLMSFFYAKNASFDVEKYLLHLCVADYQIDDATNKSPDGYNPTSQTISRSLLQSIEQLEPEATGHLYSQQIELDISDQAGSNLRNFYTQERLKEFESFDPTFPQWKETFDLAIAGNSIPITIYGADGLILEAATNNQYLLDGSFDAEQFATGNYVLAIGPSISPGTGMPTYSVGESIEIKGHSFTVMAILSPLAPLESGTAPAFDLPLIMSADAFTTLWPDSNLRKFYFNVEDEHIEAASKLLSDYQQNTANGMNITSRQTMVEQYEKQTKSSSVMGYAISIIIALVGMLNFINSMVTAIVSRKKEFAMIQSIGMTKRQLSKMLTYEGLFYAILTLLASYILGVFTVGIVVRAIVSEGYSTFHFTLAPLLICTPLLILFAMIIPYLCFKNLEQQSIVERLKAID